nr:MAG: RNA-dependent RNA polymerase [Riboviria sp.]
MFKVSCSAVSPLLSHQVLYALCDSVGTPFGRGLQDALRSGDEAVVSYLNSYSGFWTSSNDSAGDYLLAEVMSKFENFDVDINKQEVALESFFESESQCKATNSRLGSRRTLETRLQSGLLVSDIFYVAKRKIASVLGDFSWDAIIGRCGFGPGANVGIPRMRSSTTNKIGFLNPTTTAGCRDLGNAMLKWHDLWGCYLTEVGFSPEVVPGNRVVTVPKNYKTDRVIAIEPLWNSYFQRGLGQFIRSRLKRVGIDLNDQTPNQRAALRGSKDGSCATIDLKAASDTISEGLVSLLLPSDWFYALNAVRSHRGVLPSGELITYQKFSSMGNGSTFELESLIFWAICSSVLQLSKEKDNTLLVYGDDIVVPSSSAELVIDALEFCGFSVNRKKTHIDGSFRESCGKHYLGGVDITPFYIRKNVTGLERNLWLCNAIKRYAFRAAGSTWGLDSRFKFPWLLASSHLPERLQVPSIPDGFGDGALIGDLMECQPVASRMRNYVDGWHTHHLVRVYKKKRRGGVPALIDSLLSADRKEVRNDQASPAETSVARSQKMIAGFALGWLEGSKLLPGQDAPQGKFPENTPGKYSLRKSRLFVPKQWQDLGPWL